MDIINKIVFFLNQNGKTQKELTDYLGIEKSVFSTWKTGKSQSYTRYIPQIATFLGISSDILTSDGISFDIEPHSLPDTEPICCPICSSCITNFRKTRSVDFKNEKSGGLALEFFCEEGHTFYLLIESYKGNTYTLLTDESCNNSKRLGFDTECSPISLEELFTDSISKKYRILDGYGKRAVDCILDVEYERCASIQKEPKIRIRYSILPVSAGAGVFLDDENIEFREFPDTPEARQADIVIPVDGRSMEPMFYDGDLLLVKQQEEIEPGQIGIFIKEGKGYVKKLAEDRLISINPDYEDIYPGEGEEVVCKGRVIGKV